MSGGGLPAVVVEVSSLRSTEIVTYVPFMNIVAKSSAIKRVTCGSFVTIQTVAVRPVKDQRVYRCLSNCW